MKRRRKWDEGKNKSECGERREGRKRRGVCLCGHRATFHLDFQTAKNKNTKWDDRDQKPGLSESYSRLHHSPAHINSPSLVFSVNAVKMNLPLWSCDFPSFVCLWFLRNLSSPFCRVSRKMGPRSSFLRSRTTPTRHGSVCKAGVRLFGAKRLHSHYFTPLIEVGQVSKNQSFITLSATLDDSWQTGPYSSRVHGHIAALEMTQTVQFRE